MSMTRSETFWSYVVVEKYMDENGIDYERAYKDLAAKYDEDYKDLESKLAIAVKALEFYSNPDNWRVNPDYSHEYDVIDSDDTYVSGAELHKKSNKVLEVHSGGRKARQALEKIR